MKSVRGILEEELDISSFGKIYRSTSKPVYKHTVRELYHLASMPYINQIYSEVKKRI